MTAKRFPNTLTAFVAREAASTGQQKRWCAACDRHVLDQDRTASIYCQDCRGQDRRPLRRKVPDHG